MTNISAGVHRIRFEKELDGMPLSRGSFYPVGVLMVPLSSSPLQPSSRFRAMMATRDIESGLGRKSDPSLYPANDEIFNSHNESGRRKPLASRLIMLDLNPFKILSGKNSTRVSDPTAAASSQRLSPEVLQSHQPPGGARVADDAASDRSTAGLLGKSGPAVYPATAELPAATVTEEGEESVECPLGESTAIVTAIFSLRLPLHKLLPNDMESPPTRGLSGAPTSTLSARASSLPPIQPVSTLVPKDIKVTPTELMILDTTGHVYLSREIFGLGAAVSVVNTSHNDPSPPAPQDETAQEVKRDVVMTDLGDPSERRSLSGSLNSSIGSAGTSSLGSLHAGAVQDEGHRGAKTYERLSSSTGGEEDQIRSSSLSREEGQGAAEQKGGEPSSPSAAGQGSSASASIDIATETALTIGGGKYTREECVVCFTEHKEVMLLPCRCVHSKLLH
jgi:hypothetical protein